MKNSSNRLLEIRARLEAATPGPWRAVRIGLDDDGTAESVREVELEEGEEQSYAVVRSTAPRGQVAITDDEEGKTTAPTAEFIANAPADVAWLIEQLDNMRTWALKSDEANDELRAEVETLRRRRTRMTLLSDE